MVLSLPLVWMLLFGVRYSLAVRTHGDSQSGTETLITEDGQQKELPECHEIAKDTYPGGCNPAKSAFACYSLEKSYKPEHADEPVEVHWACSQGLDQTDISKEACLRRPWNFEDEVNGKQVKFTADAGIYAGACEFSTLPGGQEATTKTATKAATTPATKPQQLTKAATTPVQSTEAATTPQQVTEAATTQMQPTVGPTTTKNGTAGYSAGSLLSIAFFLAVSYLH